MRHADPQPDHPLGSRAAQGAKGATEVGQDRLDRMAPPDGIGGLDVGSHGTKYLAETNSSVNPNCS
jgi:hypothetical protein